MPAAEKGMVRFREPAPVTHAKLRIPEETPQTQSKEALPNLSSKGRSPNSCDHSP